MKRYYYIADELDDLATVQLELELQGVSTPQIHVLSLDDAAVAKRHLHEVEAVLKKDVVHSMELGALVGVAGGALVLLAAYLSGLTTSPAGWIPFIFLAIVVLGFCTWEGGFFGIQRPHNQFVRFKRELDAGKHIFFVDLYPVQRAILSRIVDWHPNLRPAGAGTSTPAWVVKLQNRWREFVQAMP